MSTVYGSIRLKNYECWRSVGPTKRQALRELLNDGKWHDQEELMMVGGFRYGARLMELRRGIDGYEPLTVESEVVGGNDRVWRYRAKRGAK